MEKQDLVALVDRLRAEQDETEWLEFKAKRYEAQEIGEYLSALANAACLAGKSQGYLLFGVSDASHEVVGTKFSPTGAKGKGNQPLLLWLSHGLDPNVGFDVHVVTHPDGSVVLFVIGPARDCPVRFYGTAYIRVGSSKTTLSKYPEKERALWSRGVDWSAAVCENATLPDLDPGAIRKAREQFTVKHPAQVSESAEWSDKTLLNKAKVTRQGRITNAALLLLGRNEAASLLSPAVAKISWVLKDGRNLELDYEHFGPPFLLAVDRVLQRIRNLTVRALPSGTLFPQEMSQYDPWVVREALHNCIGHQDYQLGGRVNVVETPDRVLLTNVGSFLPGSIARVVQQDAPLEIYRNPFLAEAMVELNMIDTQGGGIKRMFLTQRRRSFPLPDYDLSEPNRVEVAISGRILDERYTRLLMERTDLDLWQVMLLDRVQKRQDISRDEHRGLKSAGLVEGRFPNLMVAGGVAKATGESGRYIRERGFDKQYYLDLILALVGEHGPVTRQDVDDALLSKLPDRLTAEQKRRKVHNLLQELRLSGSIVNQGTRSRPKWIVVEPSHR